LIADVSALNGGVKKFKAWCVAVVYEGAITVHARRIEFVVSQANRHVDILIQLGTNWGHAERKSSSFVVKHKALSESPKVSKHRESLIGDAD
jgi:hypothetical protein